MLTLLDKRVLATLAYCDQFEYPLSAQEIKQRLISQEVWSWLVLKDNQQNVNSKNNTQSEISSKTTFSLRGNDIKVSLSRLVAANRVVVKKSKYALTGSKKHFVTRQTRAKATQAKQPVIQQFVALARRLPWIKAVVITGSVAVDNSTSKDDIDFFIITQNGRLWLVRLIVTFVSWLKGRRPADDRSQANPNKWCFNFWLGEDNLTLPANRRQVYEAYEVIQTKWVYDQADTKSLFIEENSWLSQFLPHGKLNEKSHTQSKARQADLWRQRRGVGDWWWRLLNYFAFIIQTNYRRFKHGEEDVSLETVFFYQARTRQLIYRRWKQRLKSLSL